MKCCLKLFTIFIWVAILMGIMVILQGFSAAHLYNLWETLQ
jgi:hypothetical protein